MTFIGKIEARQRKVNSLFCVGLDSEYEKIPEYVREFLCLPRGKQDKFDPVVVDEFNRRMADATYPYTCAYKLNVAFYEAWGSPGFAALEASVRFLKNNYSDVPIILDGKRGDIGNTNRRGYARYAFDVLGVDAVTVPPYLGEESLQPFLERKDKGVIVLCHTSNPGAPEFQDMLVSLAGKEFKEAGEFFLNKGLLEMNPGPSVPLYQWVAYRVAHHWNKNNNCLLVVGATYPEELKKVRQIVGNMPILVPGVGTQGGDLEEVLENGLRPDGLGLIINASRSVIFDSSDKDFAEVASREVRKLRDLINKHRRGA